MIDQSFPRWAIWLMNIAMLAIIWGLSELFKLAGWQVALGFGAGFLCCYLAYHCWRVDDANEGYTRFPPEEREARWRRDRAIDPRL